jgi:hypothetical protein
VDIIPAAKPLFKVANLTTGTSQAIDFNPVADRLRFINTVDSSNYRINVDDGTIVPDTALTFAAGDSNAGKTPHVVAGAYTNSLTPTPASTTLYDLDSTLDVLLIQNPPNNGVLTTVGPLGVDIGDNAAFDIATVTSGGESYGFVLNEGNLYSIDLPTGKMTLIGKINTNQGLRGLVVRPLP